MTSITPDELAVWIPYIHGLCGITLDHTKAYLLETRLGPLLQETGSPSYAELFYKVKTDASRALRRKVVNAITTRETSFFRDTAPFELLQHKVIPDLIDRRRRIAGPSGVVPLRIWSAACSSGQELYSIAITLTELLAGRPGYEVQMLGTDISDQAVASASYGEFNRFDLERGLSPERINKYFTPSGASWKIRDELRAMVTFRQMNLLEPFSMPTRHDVIFCRNVAIYFTEPDRARLFTRLGQCLPPDGTLVIGSTESLTGLCPQFEAKRHLRSVYYQLRPAGALP